LIAAPFKMMGHAKNVIAGAVKMATGAIKCNSP